MVCDEVRRVAYFYLDGTLSEQKRRLLMEHLGLCEDCDRRLAVHRRFRTFLQARLHPMAAPTGLKERISVSFRTLRA